MKKNKIKILVTGSKGLIGSEFLNQLEKKDYILKGIDIETDILSKKFLIQLNNFNPKIIIHCASHPGGLSFVDPRKNILINYIGTFNIIKWCSENRCKLIFLSSSAVYGDRKKKIKIKENDPLEPETVYGINKLAVEKSIISYSKNFKLDWIIFRLFATFGPGHKKNNYQGIINIILSQLKNTNQVIIKGSIKRMRSIIYVKDAVNIMLNIIFKKINKKIINISSGKDVSIKDLIKIIEKKLRKKIYIKTKKKTPGDPFYNLANINYMKKISRLKNNYNIEKGINETLKLKNFKVY